MMMIFAYTDRNFPAAVKFGEQALKGKAKEPALEPSTTRPKDPLPRSRIHYHIAGMFGFQRTFASALQHLKQAVEHEANLEEKGGYVAQIGSCCFHLGRRAEARKYLTDYVEDTLPSIDPLPHRCKTRQHFCNNVLLLAETEYGLGNFEAGDRYFKIGKDLLPTLSPSGVQAVDNHYRLAQEAKRKGRKKRDHDDSDFVPSARTVLHSATFHPGDVVEVVAADDENVGERGHAQEERHDAKAKDSLCTVVFCGYCPSIVQSHQARKHKISQRTAVGNINKATYKEYTVDIPVRKLKLIYSKVEAEKARKEFVAGAEHVTKQGRFFFGDEVVIDGLVAKPELNGRHALVRRVINECRPRYEVELLPKGTTSTQSAASEGAEEPKPDAPLTKQAQKHAKKRAEKKAAAAAVEAVELQTSEATPFLHILPKNLKRSQLPDCMCGICQDTLEDPITLESCGHKYCGKCLATHETITQAMEETDDLYAEDETATSGFACPVCRVETKLSDETWNLLATATFQARQERAAAAEEKCRNVYEQAKNAKSEKKAATLPGLMGSQTASQKFAHLTSGLGINEFFREEMLKGLPEKSREAVLTGTGYGHEITQAFEEDYAAQRAREAAAYRAGRVAAGDKNLGESDEAAAARHGKKNIETAAEALAGSARPGGDSSSEDASDYSSSDEEDGELPPEFLNGGRDVVGVAADGSDDPVIQRSCNVALNKADRYGDGDQTSLSCKPGDPGCDLEAYWSTGGNFDPFGAAARAGLQYSPLLRAAAWGNVSEVQAVLDVCTENEGVLEDGTAVAKKKSKKKLRHLLELRESSLRVTPLYACIVGARHMVENDPRVRFSWPHRPAREEIDHVKCAEILLKAGANPNAKDVLGNSLFQFAINWFCSDESLRIAKMLLEYGADPDPHNRLGQCLIQEYVVDRNPSELPPMLGGNTKTLTEKDGLKAPLVLDGSFTSVKDAKSFPVKMIRLLLSWGVDLSQMRSYLDFGYDMKELKKQVSRMSTGHAAMMQSQMADKEKMMNEQSILIGCTHKEVKRLLHEEMKKNKNKRTEASSSSTSRGVTRPGSGNIKLDSNKKGKS